MLLTSSSSLQPVRRATAATNSHSGIVASANARYDETFSTSSSRPSDVLHLATRGCRRAPAPPRCTGSGSRSFRCRPPTPLQHRCSETSAGSMRAIRRRELGEMRRGRADRSSPATCRRRAATADSRGGCGRAPRARGRRRRSSSRCGLRARRRRALVLDLRDVRRAQADAGSGAKRACRRDRHAPGRAARRAGRRDRCGRSGLRRRRSCRRPSRR